MDAATVDNGVENTDGEGENESAGDEVVDGEGTGIKVVAIEGTGGDWKNSPALIDVVVVAGVMVMERVVLVCAVSTIWSWTPTDVVGDAALPVVLDEVVMGMDEGRGGGSKLGERVESSQAFIHPS